MSTGWKSQCERERGSAPASTTISARRSEPTVRSQGQGASVKRREDMHKMAEANKAFAHYRW